MLKKDITFKDLDGNSVTKTFYFALSKVEIAKLALSEGGGLVEYINNIIAKQDAEKIIEAFERILKLAYGVRGEDNLRFIKSEQLSAEFMQTDAYDSMFFQLVTDATFAAEFITAIIPPELAKDLPAKISAMTPVVDVALPPSEITDNLVEEAAKHIANSTEGKFILPPAGDKMPGPFGLTDFQISVMSSDELRAYAASPEAFRK